MFGTMLLTVIFLCGQGQISSASFAQQQIALLLGLWVLIIFGFRISGAHYNPAISLAFMFRKDIGHFPRPLGIAYILF
jgi:glycerol uptake facilitator-like aquaporin